MQKFNLNLFVNHLNEAKELSKVECEKKDHLKEIVLMIYEKRIDYNAFIFEEISEVYEQILQLQYNPTNQENLFTQLEKIVTFNQKLLHLPRRREGHVFI